VVDFDLNLILVLRSTYKIGINASGIRKVIQAPSRYAIPLIVSTGLPNYVERTRPSTSPHDRTTLMKSTDRYPMEEVMFGDTFGAPLPTIPALTST
jgi:hypothetical protein